MHKIGEVGKWNYLSMTYSLSNNCTKNYYNRTLTVQDIVEDVVTWIFLRHSVYTICSSEYFCNSNKKTYTVVTCKYFNLFYKKTSSFGSVVQCHGHSLSRFLFGWSATLIISPKNNSAPLSSLFLCRWLKPNLFFQFSDECYTVK